jgi:2-polyprenyl-3-methyl-5-hydroxy-6-metoxy-1,4-benzoquinol methylase
VDERERLIRHSWTENAAAWTDAVRGRRIESRAAATDGAVHSAIRECLAARVLDVGCGEGWLCRALAEASIEVVGFDATPELIARAREAAVGGSVAYLTLGYDDFAADPARVGSGFDAAVCNFSLLGRDIASTLSAAASVLRPGGALLIQTVHPFADMSAAGRYEDGWRVEDFAALGPGFRAPMPWYFRTVGSWINELTAAGFTLAECREPVHPATGQPLSLLLIGRTPRSDCGFVRA